MKLTGIVAQIHKYLRILSYGAIGILDLIDIIKAGNIESATLRALSKPFPVSANPKAVTIIKNGNSFWKIFLITSHSKR